MVVLTRRTKRSRTKTGSWNWETSRFRGTMGLDQGRGASIKDVPAQGR